MKCRRAILICLSLIAAVLLTGCATTKPEYDANGEIIEPASYGKCTVGKYKGLSVTETTLPVTEEDIEIAVKYWRNRGDESTDDELRERCREDLELSMKASSREQAISDLMDQIINKSSFSINDTAVDFQYQELNKYYKEFAEYNGMTIENFIAMYGTDAESFDHQVKDEAKMIVKEILVKQAIFDKEGMTLTDEEKADEKNAVSARVKDFIYDNAVITAQ